MDILDVKILRYLWEDGRMPVYKIAEKLGISGVAVDRRINAMMARGELLGFAVLLNSEYILNSSVIALRAKKNRKKVFDKISKIPGVMHFVGCLGGHYYGEFWYGDSFELEEKSMLFKELTDSYSIELYHHQKREEAALDSIDWKIILAMKDNSRVAFSKLAKEIGISAKTISRRWERLRAQEIVKAYPVVNRPFSKDIFWFSLFIEVDELSIESRIAKMENLWRTSIFKEPKMIYGVFFAQFVKDIDATMERVVCMKGVKKVHYEMIVEEQFYRDYVVFVASKKNVLQNR